MRTLFATFNGRAVGVLSEGNDLWRFAYDPAWASSPDGFDLSPALARHQAVHEDGSSLRPVQWYFDNLLPEEHLRDAVRKEAGLTGDDAFALLEYLGAESAGSLILRPPDALPVEPSGLRPLSDEDLCRRIRQMDRIPLSQEAPKRMSVAGAQHKLLVVVRDGRLFEPVGDEPSTHILKPNHPGADYPASVINEYATMRLAQRLRLNVPGVRRHYSPEPVYIVERFDRAVAPGGPTRRLHVIDACQLLSKARVFKYQAANLDTLADIVQHCRNRASTRLQLYAWLVFNVLVGNHDNHLKNLSFTVAADGVDLAPAYDLLSTASYHTQAFAAERANWPNVEMAIALPGAKTFGQVTRAALIEAGLALGLTSKICSRELDRMAASLPTALDAVTAEVEQQNPSVASAAAPYLAGESRLLHVLRHIVVREMLSLVAPA